MPFQAWIPDDGLSLRCAKGWLQWGHALSGMDTPAPAPAGQGPRPRFNGAMPFQAWIHHSRTRWKGSKTSGFNGAMPFQAWIQYLIPTEMIEMFALQWGHALSGMDTRHFGLKNAILVSLQWGHALSGMDTHQFCFDERFNMPASMGPCPFRHGYGRDHQCDKFL